MGKGITQTHTEYLQGKRGVTRWTTRLRSRRLVRGLTCCLALSRRWRRRWRRPLRSSPVRHQPPWRRVAPVATSVGNVPAPSTAAPFDPNAIIQPALATPTPALTSSVKTLGIETPTTAEPGGCCRAAAARRSARRLGARDPLQLRGTDGQNGIAFSVRNDEVVTGVSIPASDLQLLRRHLLPRSSRNSKCWLITARKWPRCSARARCPRWWRPAHPAPRRLP